MNNDFFDDAAIEQIAKDRFGVSLEVSTVVARRIDYGQAALATFFLSAKKQLYCYIEGSSQLTLGDIRKMAVRMGVRPEVFFPPKGQPQYFEEIARDMFVKVYPGRRDISQDDLRFYRTLVPYCPALFLVEEVKNGTIYCADHDASSGWRPAAKFVYRRLRTS